VGPAACWPPVRPWARRWGSVRRPVLSPIVPASKTWAASDKPWLLLGSGPGRRGGGRGRWPTLLGQRPKPCCSHPERWRERRLSQPLSQWLLLDRRSGIDRSASAGRRCPPTCRGERPSPAGGVLGPRQLEISWPGPACWCSALPDAAIGPTEPWPARSCPAWAVGGAPTLSDPQLDACWAWSWVGVPRAWMPLPAPLGVSPPQVPHPGALLASLLLGPVMTSS